MKHITAIVLAVFVLSGVANAGTGSYARAAADEIRAASVSLTTTADLSDTFSLNADSRIEGVVVYADVDLGKGTNVKIAPAGFTKALGATEADADYAKNAAKEQTIATTGTTCLVFDKEDFGSGHGGVLAVGSGTLTSTSCSITMRYRYANAP